MALLAGLVFVLRALFPTELPESADPSFVDVIFESRGVIWAARVLLLSAAVVLAVGGVFIVGSTVMRMRNGDWLKRAGPFEVSETALADLEAQIGFWRTAALEGQDEVAALRELLDESNDVVAKLRQLATGTVGTEKRGGWHD